MGAATSTVAGKIGEALSFNGTTTAVTIPNSSTLNITGSSITISAWVKCKGDSLVSPSTGGGGYSDIISKGWGDQYEIGVFNKSR